MSSHYETALERHRQHIVDVQVAYQPVHEYRLRNRRTERELKVNICERYCEDCRKFLQTALWASSSPLNDMTQLPLEMSLVGGRPATSPRKS